MADFKILNGYNVKDGELRDKLNFSNTGVPTLISSYGTIDNSSVINYAVNSDGSIGKLYGFLRVNNSSIEDSDVTIVYNTPFRPTEEFIVNGYGIADVYERVDDVTSNMGMQWAQATFKTNGNVELTFGNNPRVVYRNIYLPAIIIFAKNFGDVSPL